MATPSPTTLQTSPLTWIDLPPGPEAKYLKLYKTLRAGVVEGRLTSGTRLPATRQLAKSLKLSRNTIITAYEMLVAEGYAEAHRGAGHVICQHLPDQFTRVEESSVQPEPTVAGLGLSKRGQWADQLIGKQSYSPPRPFAPGVPDYNQIPMDLLARIVARHWRQAKPSDLGYLPANGHLPLRQAVADYLRTSRGVRCNAEQIFITHGAQQALDLIGQLFLDPGTPVWMEDPGYDGARGVFRAHGATIQSRPIDDQGMVIAETFKQAPKLIYVTPSHQYPLGITMSLQRRLQLLHFANAHGSWIIEDDYDSEFRYEGRPLPALQGLAANARVFYVGTLSKVLFPSLRLGYLVVPPHLLETFSRARAYRDSSPPTLIQAAIGEFMAKGYFASHLRRMRQAYRQRQACLRDALAEKVGPWLTADPTPAGMHLIARATIDLDDVALAEKAAAQGLVLRPLSQFYAALPPKQGFVLGFAGFAPKMLQDYVERLATILKSSDDL